MSFELKSMTNETLKNYLNYLIIKGYNEETSHTRTGQVREFLDFTKLSFEQINEEHINQYYYYLKQRPNKLKPKKTISLDVIISLFSKKKLNSAGHQIFNGYFLSMSFVIPSLPN